MQYATTLTVSLLAMLAFGADAHGWGLRGSPAFEQHSHGKGLRFVLRKPVDKLRSSAREAIARPMTDALATIETWEHSPAGKKALKDSYRAIESVLHEASAKKPVTLTVIPLADHNGVAVSVAKSAQSHLTLSVVPLVAFSAQRQGERVALQYEGRVSGARLAAYFASQPRRFSETLAREAVRAASIRYEASARGSGLGEGLMRLFDERGALLGTASAKRGQFMQVLGETFLR